MNREKDRSREAAGEKGRRAARRGSKAAIVICVILVLVFGAVAAYMIWEKPPERPGGGLVDPTAPSVSPDGDVSASPSAQPTEDPDAGAPASLNENMYTFLVVGLDKVGYNTDTMMIGRMDTKTHEINVVSIPRDTMVTTDRSVSGNYRINNIAKTQAADSNSMNMAALCEQISNMYQLPSDGYMTIRLEMLVQLVDTFGGIELYVPQEMDYKGSHLDQGYQTLNGDACEFLLRTRHVYNNGDIGRLNMQRQFYSALFRRLKSIGNIWDVAKLTPAVLNYMETSLSASKLVSFAVSMLKIDSSKIMICQMPVKMAGKYNGESVVYPARQEDADILNQYFRENTGFVDASELQLCDDASVLGFDLSGYTATDANVQYMGQLNQEAADAQQNQNLDGSHTVEYVDSESTDTADSSSDSTESESQPAA